MLSAPVTTDYVIRNLSVAIIQPTSKRRGRATCNFKCGDITTNDIVSDRSIAIVKPTTIAMTITEAR